MPDKYDIKSSRTKKQPAKRESWMSDFVPLYMDDNAKAACREWTYWEAHDDDLLASLCESGYAIRVKADDRSEGYMAFIQPCLNGHAHAGWILSGRGSTPMKAIKQACYQHFVMLEEIWPTEKAFTSQADFDD